MNANNLGRTVSLLIAIPVVLTAQLAPDRDPVVLKNWASSLVLAANPSSAGAVRYAAGDHGESAIGHQRTGVCGHDALPHCRYASRPGIFRRLWATGLGREEGTGRTFPVQSSTTCSIPSIARAYSFNLTVVAPAPLGFITAYPTPGPLPLAATLNWAQSLIVGNAAIVPAGTSGSVDFFAYADTDLVIDINGYYAPPGDLQANTALGFRALQSNTTGKSNTASGDSALIR